MRASKAAAQYFEALRTTPLVEALFASELQLERARTQLCNDPPIKVRGKAPDASLMYSPRLNNALATPERGIDLVSPYFVPGKKGTKVLAQFAAQGIALRILTNSLAATDVVVVHAGYAKRRKPLLRNGVRIYELKATFNHLSDLMSAGATASAAPPPACTPRLSPSIASAYSSARSTSTPARSG